MTDRINLTELREWAAPSISLGLDNAMVPVNVHTLLALIDAAEAAHRVATAHHNLPNLGDTISPNVMDALRQALDRFDHT